MYSTMCADVSLGISRLAPTRTDLIRFAPGGGVIPSKRESCQVSPSFLLIHVFHISILNPSSLSMRFQECIRARASTAKMRRMSTYDNTYLRSRMPPQSSPSSPLLMSCSALLDTCKWCSVIGWEAGLITTFARPAMACSTGVAATSLVPFSPVQHHKITREFVSVTVAS